MDCIASQSSRPADRNETIAETAEIIESHLGACRRVEWLRPYPAIAARRRPVEGSSAIVDRVELLVVDAMGAFDLAVQVGCPRPDVDVADVEFLRCQWKWD
jgi:hypothetical protein